MDTLIKLYGLITGKYQDKYIVPYMDIYYGARVGISLSYRENKGVTITTYGRNWKDWGKLDFIIMEYTKTTD